MVAFFSPASKKKKKAEQEQKQKLALDLDTVYYPAPHSKTLQTFVLLCSEGTYAHPAAVLVSNCQRWQQSCFFLSVDSFALCKWTIDMDLLPSDEHFAQQFAKQVITYW